MIFCTSPHPRWRLSKENRSIDRHFTTQTLDLILAASTKRIKANAIFLRFNQLVETRSQLSILLISQIDFKNTELNCLTIGLQDIVNFSTTAIVRDIVTDDEKHGRNLLVDNDYFITKGGYLSVSPMRNLANRRDCNSKASL